MTAANAAVILRTGGRVVGPKDLVSAATRSFARGVRKERAQDDVAAPSPRMAD